MAQIINITSEALQAAIRRLLPSQQGFGEDLQASNVITPIIDLTPTAENTSLPRDLSEAVNFTDNTSSTAINTSTTLINTSGFWRVIGNAYMLSGTSALAAECVINNGLTDKVVYEANTAATSINQNVIVPFEFVVFLPSLHSFILRSNNAQCVISATARQVASVNGVLQDPTDFTSQ